ncbi:hypothetical protein [Pinibacter soli]|uniref:Uncharacterized protein n=1 Tax=Pinibacter soli TaxID=3044211 RepID=A0ABT6RC62_9BACT|nr:hypothetical protein [Pinibacter soli]MDI3320056.1 hypothetical protein [Pinibacter soli]
MFTSKHTLVERFGVDKDIAAFFVDRKVPDQNDYWKGRLLYVSSGTGYLFIPLWFDLQCRIGIAKDLLLNEDYVQLTEAILGSAAKHEMNKISLQEHVENCKALVNGKIKQQELYNDLLTFFSDPLLKPYKNIGTVSSALNRGDSLLFSLCVLDTDAETITKLVRGWQALVPSFLLMDDVMDLEEDKKNGEENSIADFGVGGEGVINALDYLAENFEFLKQYNLKLGNTFAKALIAKKQTPYLASLISNS